MQFLNYTPHTIKMNDGTEYESKGVARISSNFTEPDINGICQVKYGEMQGLPEPQENVKYIVSSMVLSVSDRNDLVAPATGHIETIRENGRIVSVPYFVEN